MAGARTTGDDQGVGTPAGPGEVRLADAEPGPPSQVPPVGAAVDRSAGPVAGGPDGDQLESGIAEYLDYLTELCGQLGMPDPVEEYFAPVVGRWSDLHAEAERWRSVGQTAESVTDSLITPLGGLDAAWDGADADSFIDYMNRVGLAGHDLSDAMTGMADVLDKTADGIREIVQEMAQVLVDTAESTSQALSMPVQGEDRARSYLDHMRRPTRELFEAVRQVLEAFVSLCDGVDGSQAFQKIAMAHTYPEQNWAATATPPLPPAPENVPDPTEPGSAAGGGGGGGGALAGGGIGVGSGPAGPLAPGGYVLSGEPAGGAAAGTAPAAAGAAPRGAGAGGAMPFMPMGAGMGGQGGDAEHKSRSRLVSDPAEIFGTPTKTSPATVGEDD